MQQEHIDAKHQHVGKLVWKNVIIYEKLYLYKLSQYSTIKTL